MECKQCQNKMQRIIDYSGGTYTAELIKCPVCGYLRIVKYTEDENLNINFDERYYEYK